MRLSAYLIIKKKKNYGAAARITSRTPALAPDEIAIKLDMEVPDELFRRPQLQASIKIPKEACGQPVITAEIQDNIKDMLLKHSGIDLNITITESGKK